MRCGNNNGRPFSLLKRRNLNVNIVEDQTRGRKTNMLNVSEQSEIMMQIIENFQCRFKITMDVYDADIR